MKVTASNRVPDGFTLLEGLVVIAIILVVIALSIPAIDRSGKSTVAACMNNQKQIVLAQVIWSSDHNNSYSWRVAADKGGTLDFAANGDAARHFQVLSNYNLKPKSLICPTDRAKVEAASFAALDDSNLSYFVNLDATTNNAEIILTGDRHLQVNGQPVKPGLLIPGPNVSLGWTRELHTKSANVPLGVMCFADGHAEPVKEKLTAYFARQHQVTNRFAIP